jgi:heat shock protein 90kDa beta
LTIDPIWLLSREEEEVPVEDEKKPETTEIRSEELEYDSNSEEVLVEDDIESTDEESITSEPKTVKVMVDKWVQLNEQAPIWMRWVSLPTFRMKSLNCERQRDPKTVTDDEYKEFYKATFKEHEGPLA